MSASVDLGNNAGGGSFFVQDMSGQLVFSGTLPAGSGTLPVVWDGIDAEGNALPPGQYRISAEVERNGANQAASVFAHEQVVSVAIGAGNTVTLNLANGQSLGINEVKEFF
jgi:flagellar basal-body rod modification protein FlgD